MTGSGSGTLYLWLPCVNNILWAIRGDICGAQVRLLFINHQCVALNCEYIVISLIELVLFSQFCHTWSWSQTAAVIERGCGLLMQTLPVKRHSQKFLRYALLMLKVSTSVSGCMRETEFWLERILFCNTLIVDWARQNATTLFCKFYSVMPHWVFFQPYGNNRFSCIFVQHLTLKVLNFWKVT